ncbi:hypothetical protein PENANT_c019G02571 [Penicillium antarcticum]|uniref:Uncharacterized protein n=1 Tax=Penicillium antarcticum TaxID=416450 RepID=A0A1V6Q0P1_9EURO|nr:hypothetical protein PENANT_c019G02571 [Penicillium antarcticum]
MDEWQTAILEVKSLYKSQQHKQCVLRCKQLIDTATAPIDRIHKTSLYYFAGISYVCLAQAAHVYSAAKVPFLKCALEKFIAASKALPENRAPPVLNPGQTYSPVPWPESPSSRTTSGSPLIFNDSPRPESPLKSASLRDGSSVLDTKSQLARYGILTPPLSDYPSSDDSLVTAFVTTPRSIPAVSPPRQLRHIEDLCSVEDINKQLSPVSVPVEPPPHQLSPTEDPSFVDGVDDGISPVSTSDVPPRPYKLSSVSRNFSYPIGGIAQPRGAPSPASVDDELVSFDSSQNSIPIGEFLINNITRMLDSSTLNESKDDPFLSKKNLSPKIRPPVQPSPVRFPADLANPRKQSELVPSPLSVRKVSGELIKCNRSMILCGPANKESITSPKDTCNTFDKPAVTADARPSSTLSKYDLDTKRPVRPRPPRLPLKVIPRLQVNVDASHPIPTRLSPELKPVSPIRAMPTPVSIPETIPEKNTDIGFHCLTIPPVTPEQSQKSSYTSPSPACSSVTPASAARAAMLNLSNSFLREEFTREIAWLREQIDHVENIQHIHRRRSPVTVSPDRPRPQSFWTFSLIRKKLSSVFRLHSSPDSSSDVGPNIDKFGNVLRIETMVQRIARLRKENWKTGIRAPHSVWKGSDYYEKFCDDVLADLQDCEGFF